MNTDPVSPLERSPLRAPLLERWLGAATERMLDMARLEPGAVVLDVAAGTGGQTLAAARRVSPRGRVLATDTAPALLAAAAAAARAAGFDHVQVRAMDGASLDLPGDTFDAVLSRLGLHAFGPAGGQRLARALAGMRRVLKPGGRIAVMVHADPGPGTLFWTQARRARDAFGLGAHGALAAALRDAGLRHVAALVVDAPLRASASEHVELASLDAAAHEALAQFETAEGFAAPCELVVGAGTK